MSSDLTQAKPYEYTLVSGPTIRIFELDAVSSNDASLPISGHLKYVSLEDAPPFLALSYAWDNETASVPLFCNGQKLLVTRSLANALRKIRLLCGAEGESTPHPDFPTRCIWMDQICIDQSKPGERSHQVKLMGQVYSRAIRTVVWLGGDTEKSPSQEPAWQLIDKIYDVFQREYRGISSLADMKLDVYSAEKHAEYGLPAWDDPAWEDLHRVISLPWFSRTWIIQEVVLSPIDPVIIHGDRLHYFDRLGWVASWLRRKGYLRQPGISRQFQNVDTIANIRRSQSKWSFDVLLMSTSAKFRASDQRDKIFGLLGMAAETHDPEQCPLALQADYTLDLSQVYQKVALHLISQYRSLVSLTRCISSDSCAMRNEAHSVQSRPMPSWVPQWSDVAKGETVKLGNLVWITYFPQGDPPVLGFPEHYKASQGLPISSWTSSEGRLRVQALRFDKVSHVWPFTLDNHSAVPQTSNYEKSTISLSTTSENGVSTIFQLWDLVRQSRDKTLPEEGLFKSFLKTLVADMSRLGGITLDQMYMDGAAYYLREKFGGVLKSSHKAKTGLFSRVWSRLLSWLGSFYQPSTSRESKGRLSQHDEPGSWMTRLAENGNPEAFAGIARVYSLQRALMMTEGGRLGLCPKETRIGDLVYVIPGGDVPYIISRVGSDGADGSSSHVLVGESWVDGLMAGEAVDAWRRGEIKDEVLELQ